MLPTTRALLLILLTAPIMALGVWIPFMEWVAWGYALFVLAVMFMDWRTDVTALRPAGIAVLGLSLFLIMPQFAPLIVYASRIDMLISACR